MTIPFEIIRQRWLEDPAFRAADAQLGPKIEVALRMAEARKRSGLTQAQVAARMGTTQSVIARLERGKTNPSVETLDHYAKALGASMKIDFIAS